MKSLPCKVQFIKRYQTLSINFKYREAVRFLCAQETGGVLQPNKLAEDCMKFIN